MKKIVRISIVLLTAAFGAWAQTDGRVAAVRTEVEAIEKDLVKYSKTSKKLAGISHDAEGVYYRSADGVRKIVAKVIGKTGRSDNEYYYRDAKLIYAIQRWTKYDRSIEEGPVKTVRVIVTIAYFDGEEAFAITVDEKPVARDSQEWKEQMYSVIATSTIYLNRM